MWHVWLIWGVDHLSMRMRLTLGILGVHSTSTFVPSSPCTPQHVVHYQFSFLPSLTFIPFSLSLFILLKRIEPLTVCVLCALPFVSIMTEAIWQSDSEQKTHIASDGVGTPNGVNGPGFFDRAAANGNTVNSATKNSGEAQHIGMVNNANRQGHFPLAQNGDQRDTPAGTQVEELAVLCGPLLNFRRLDRTRQAAVTWHGSLLVVAKPGKRQPELRLKPLGHADEGLRHGVQTLASTVDVTREQALDKERIFRALKLHEDFDKTFWCFELDITLQDIEARWEYTLLHAHSTWPPATNSIPPKVIVVPARSQSMRILFHSCNGFSVGTDEEAWSGPALWNDVIRVHEQRPFHVMIGGGDQIYNDGVRVDGPLREWADTGNPKKRRGHPFEDQLRAKCDEFYFQNYAKWYTTEPFATANGQIPQINIWDDHGMLHALMNYTVTMLTVGERYHRWLRQLH